MEHSLIKYFESESEEVIRYALQNMFWNTAKQGRFPKHIVPFKKLEQFINHSNSKIRKWAYYATCFYCNDKIADTVEKNIVSEENELIRSWMLATIYTYNSKTYSRIIQKREIGLSGNTIQLLTGLFGNKEGSSIDKSFLNQIISSDNALEKFWLTFFYKYNPFIKGCETEIPIQYITDLTGLAETDKKLCEIEEYALAALNMYSPKFSFKKDVKLKIEDIGKMDENPRKWAYTLLWKDNTLIKNNLDFVKNMMFAKNLDDKDREGFAKGLSDHYIFNKDLVNNIEDWYIKEENPIVSEYLVNYMKRHKERSKEFRKQIGYVNNDNTLKKQIMGLIFSKKIKSKRFYDEKKKTLDVAGLRVAIPEKFDIDLKTFKLDTEHYEVSERLQELDLLQFNMANYVNAISDQNTRDLKIKEIVEVQTEMLKIVIQSTI
jgi:hypothetical protein